MAVGDSWLSQFITNLGAFLDANSVGVWRDDGSPYEADEIAITDRDIPADPDQCIVLADYVVVTTHGMQDVTVGIQFRMRGTTNPNVVRDIGEAVFELLESRENFTLGDIAVVQSYRQSQAPLGKDQLGRWESSHNYMFEAMRLTANLTD